MAYDLEEQEQLATAKAYWAKYGTIILAVLTAILMAIAAYRLWGWYQAREATQAGALYVELQQVALTKDIKKSEEVAGKIFSGYKSSAYAQMAALTMGKLHADAKDLAKAKIPLQWAVDNSANEEFKHVARVRLAGILLDEKAFDDGLKLLAGEPPAAFVSLYADRRGDILLAQGKAEEARKQFKLAFDKSDAQNQAKPLIRIKLDALGGDPS
jgi:predicted negative regulator of RcsB-dependent stress response